MPPIAARIRHFVADDLVGHRRVSARRACFIASPPAIACAVISWPGTGLLGAKN